MCSFLPSIEQVIAILVKICFSLSIITRKVAFAFFIYDSPIISVHVTIMNAQSRIESNRIFELYYNNNDLRGNIYIAYELWRSIRIKSNQYLRLFIIEWRKMNESIYWMIRGLYSILFELLNDTLFLQSISALTLGTRARAQFNSRVNGKIN